MNTKYLYKVFRISLSSLGPAKLNPRQGHLPKRISVLGMDSKFILFTYRQDIKREGLTGNNLANNNTEDDLANKNIEK